MYIPKHNHEPDRARLLALMRENSFATLVTVQAGLPVATHLPFIVREDSETLVLTSHMARANKQWQAFAPEREALVIFQGAHAYISPEYYDHEQNVPTWNYVAIHAYGVPQLITDEPATLALLESMIDSFGADYKAQWQSLSEDYRHKMLKGIVPFEMRVANLEGKLKMSQNRTLTEQERIVNGLAQDASEIVRDVAKIMQENLTRPREV